MADVEEMRGGNRYREELTEKTAQPDSRVFNTFNAPHFNLPLWKSDPALTILYSNFCCLLLLQRGQLIVIILKLILNWLKKRRCNNSVLFYI